MLFIPSVAFSWGRGIPFLPFPANQCSSMTFFSLQSASKLSFLDQVSRSKKLPLPYYQLLVLIT
jgi:hypothetical protein